MMKNNTKLEETRTVEHGSIECFSYLKKHDLENYDKEEVANPEGDEDKAKHKDLVKSKRIISICIRYYMYHSCIFPRICLIQ